MAGQEGFRGTVEWVAEVGGAAGAVGLFATAVAIQKAKHDRKSVERIKAALPVIECIDEQKFSAAMDTLSADSRGRTILAPLAANIELGGGDEGLFYQALEKSAMNMREALAERDSKADVGAIDAAYVLDQAFPIDVADSLTREYVPGERHWFDFAFAQAEEERFTGLIAA